MAERPILFQGAMVRALLAGTKTQTRRAVKGMALEWLGPEGFTPEFVASPENHLCPYGFAGDRLWVREAWAYHVHAQAAARDEDGPWVYAADGAHALQQRLCDHWRPSIHMPRVASRILLEITAVRVERLQEISSDDAAAEGWPGPDAENSIRSAYPIAWYSHLWDSINAKPGLRWQDNPYVWVVSFRRVQPA